MIALLSFPVLLLLLFVLFLPKLIEPIDPFEQGPGAAVAYVSLVQQLRAQEEIVASGGQITLHLTEQEWNGLLASAILSGKGSDFPVKRIRSALLQDGLRLETIIEPPPGTLPRQLERPIGLRADLRLLALDERTLSFTLADLRLGYLPVPNYALRTLAPRLGNPLPGFDLTNLRLTLPLADLVEGQVHRNVSLNSVNLGDGRVLLTAQIGQPQ